MYRTGISYLRFKQQEHNSFVSNLSNTTQIQLIKITSRDLPPFAIDINISKQFIHV